MSEFLRAYLLVAVFGAAAVLVVSGVLGLGSLIRPKHPNRQKLTTYESGMDPVGNAWSQTQIRYYVFAFLFVIFDVESVFLFPWALVFDRIGVAAFWEMVVFVGVLAIGLLYAFKKGVLRWA